MRFYSGFALSEDQHFFDPYLKQSEYTVAGFSYGAIKAAQYAQRHMSVSILFSFFPPLFFKPKKSRFAAFRWGDISKTLNGIWKTF
jgi:alpha/beta superfamily hydrolase